MIIEIGGLSPTSPPLNSDSGPAHYNHLVAKKRLDLMLVEAGLAESRAKAQALIMAGQVRVDGEVELKPGTSLEPTHRLEVGRGPRFVSRGGEKLEAALQAFGVPVAGRICADVGAATGGFTDCLLQRGAAKVYAVDVGKGGLHWRLRTDPRVVVMEGVNARFVEALPEPVSVITMDASFISLKTLLPVVKKWLVPAPREEGSSQEASETTKEPGGDLIVLIKPQFEAGRKEVSRGDGVVRDPEIHRRVLSEVLAFAQTQGLGVRGLMRSPLLGPKGNVEFLCWLGFTRTSAEVNALIEAALAPAAEAGK